MNIRPLPSAGLVDTFAHAAVLAVPLMSTGEFKRALYASQDRRLSQTKN